MDYTFDFAVSFARDCRPRAEKLASLLEQQGATVFYDRSFLAHLLGRRLDDELGWVFGEGTRFFVLFVSAEYTRNPWPQYEWSIAKLEAKRRDEAFVLPLRVDDSLLVGLPDTVGYLDIRDIGLEDVADILMAKLEGSKTKAGSRSTKGEWIVTFGLNLEELDWEEMPTDAPSHTPWLYEWLREDLMKRLSEGSLSAAQITEDSRNGETMGVRLAFMWDPAEGSLDFGDMGWWEILELCPYDAIYGGDN